MALITRFTSFNVSGIGDSVQLHMDAEYLDDTAPGTIIATNQWTIDADEFHGMTANQARARANAIIDGWGRQVKAANAKKATAATAFGPLVGVARPVP